MNPWPRPGHVLRPLATMRIVREVPGPSDAAERSVDLFQDAEFWVHGGCRSTRADSSETACCGNRSYHKGRWRAGVAL